MSVTSGRSGTRWLPPALILVNNDLTPSVQNLIVRQLKIDLVMDGYGLDSAVATDPNYKKELQARNQRVMVLRNFQELQNRNLFDLVMFYYNGLIQVEASNLGPHAKSFKLENLSWGLLGIY
jgi:hypothetical protein